MKKLALITGASKGIGFAIAQSLAPHFENLILIARDRKKLEEAAKKLPSKGVVILDADLTDEKEIAKVAEYIKKEYSSLDLLVNNAGIYIGKEFEKNPIEEIIYMTKLNFTSYPLVTHALLPLLKKGTDAQIINTSSCATTARMHGEAVYSATKAAVSAFGDVLRKEINSEGIRVTTIQPWGVDTYPIPMPETLLAPSDIGNLVEYIVLAPPTVQIDLVELSHIKQWRGEKPAWVA